MLKSGRILAYSFCAVKPFTTVFDFLFASECFYVLKEGSIVQQ